MKSVFSRSGNSEPVFFPVPLPPPLVFAQGQASDCAHLPNERIRVTNLMNGKEVIKHFLRNLGGDAGLQRSKAASGSTPPVQEQKQ